MTKIISRGIARDYNLKKFYTGIPCKHDHTCERRVSDGGCVECSAIRSSKWQKIYGKDYRDKVKDNKAKYDSLYRETNAISISKIQKVYTEKNKVEKQRYDSKRYQSNKESIKERRRSYYRDNKAYYTFKSRLRKASNKKRTPSWLTEDDLRYIEDLYSNCRDAESLFGSIGLDWKFHVDHIIPLQGKIVSGLHVPNNLQILTATENLSKSNKFIEELVYE